MSDERRRWVNKALLLKPTVVLNFLKESILSTLFTVMFVPEARGATTCVATWSDFVMPQFARTFAVTWRETLTVLCS